MDPLPTSPNLPQAAKPACDPESGSPTKRKARGRKQRRKTKPVPSAPRRFPRFPDLPAELRLAIWESALPSGPRLLLPKFLDLGKTAYQFGFPFYVAHIGPPALFWACREAHAVALRGVAGATLRGPWADLREDIVFVPFEGDQRAEHRTHMLRVIGPAVLTGVLCAPQVVVEIGDDALWTRRFAQYTIHCPKLVRLFLVVAGDRPPTNRALTAGWLAAERIHRKEQYDNIGVPVKPSMHPPPQIVILLRRRNYAFPAGTWSMDLKDFLSNFMAVEYKCGHDQPTIGRHGVLKSV